jgi:selenophosphate synthase
VSYDDDVTKEEQLILCDAQTSAGGLLAAVAPDQAEK